MVDAGRDVGNDRDLVVNLFFDLHIELVAQGRAATIGQYDKTGNALQVALFSSEMQYRFGFLQLEILYFVRAKQFNVVVLPHAFIQRETQRTGFDDVAERLDAHVLGV